MPHRKSQKLAKQTTDLAIATPQVIAQRMAKMMMAGPNPSTKDIQEFYSMGTEKVLAAQQSWFAMSYEITRANQQMMTSMMTAMWMPWTASSAPLFSPVDYQRSMLDIMNKGIAPIRKAAVSNAKRLNKENR